MKSANLDRMVGADVKKRELSGPETQVGTIVGWYMNAADEPVLLILNHISGSLSILNLIADDTDNLRFSAK